MRQVAVALMLSLVGVLVGVVQAPPAWTQSEDGATMTVLRGEVALLRPDGSAVQPAPSGTVVYGGDEIRTLTSTGALITFQVGTEIELGDDTILTIERVSRQGERIDVSVKQVQGVTLHRVASFSNPGSSYRVDAGGVVTEVRGTQFVLLGPLPNGAVILVCSQDCDPRSTFLGQPLGPGIGYWAEVENGKVLQGPTMFKPDVSGGLWNAAFEAATLVEQALQGDTDGVPAGQVPAGQQGQVRSQDSDIKDQRQKGPPNDGATTGPPRLSIGDAVAIENDGAPNFAVFTVTRIGSTGEASAVHFLTADGTALAGVDYDSTGGILIFPPGSASETISIPIIGDDTVEPTETFVVNLSSPLNATILDSQGLGTIFDDDVVAPLPSLSIDDREVVEGDGMPNYIVFTVTRTGPTGLASSVDFATADGTAIDGSDYDATSGTLIFPPGSASETISVLILDDFSLESDETFVVNLTSPVGATISDDQGECLITDDDVSP